MVILRELQDRTNVDSTNGCVRRAALVRRLHSLTQRNGYGIIQTNGQRVYAPSPSLNIPPPPRGCEVFIGKLHRHLYEDELIPIFESIGPLYQFRLMLDFREQTRGFAFATYFTKFHADLAVQRLDGYEIRRGLHIGVFKSVDNRRLFIGNVPPQATQADVRMLLDRYVEGVVEVIMYADYDQPHLNRGFVFAEFENHRLAAMARRQLSPENVVAWGRVLYVDWADPVPDVNPRIMAKVSVLYLSNLPINYTSEEIYTIVCNVVGAHLLKKVHKIQNYAFAHFVDRSAAEYARVRLIGLILTPAFDRHYCIQVEWARPRRFSRKFRLSNPPDNFCTSVPPNMRRLVLQRGSENSSNMWNQSSYNSFASQVPDTSSPYHE